MLSGETLKELCKRRSVPAEDLAGQMVRGGFGPKKALAAVRNWQKGLYRPIPRREDVEKLASALGVDVPELSLWRSSYRYAPISARKARLVTQLIVGRGVQDALDVLKFTRKRGASMVSKVLQSAIADADEADADVENLYVSEARVDGAGVFKRSPCTNGQRYTVFNE